MLTRTTNWAEGPAFPAVSSKRAVTSVLPAGKVMVSLTSVQNWTVEVGLPKRKLPVLSCVHAKSVELYTLKRQLQSLSASLTD